MAGHSRERQSDLLPGVAQASWPQETLNILLAQCLTLRAVKGQDEVIFLHDLPDLASQTCLSAHTCPQTSELCT